MDATLADLPNQTESVEQLLRKGELCLLKGDEIKASRFFDEASRLGPVHATHFYRQGLAYFEYGSEEGREKALLLACKKFKLTVLHAPDHIEAWHAWGNALFLLGATFYEHHYFQDAKDKYAKALSLARTKNYESLAELQWDFGAAWMQIAKHSEEAIDLHAALEAFQEASKLHSALPSDFWDDYGSACLHLSQRINDTQLFFKGMNCFKQALSISPNSARSWTNLALALEMLYSQTHDEDHFSQANDCFASVARLRPQDTELWLAWGEFLLESGRQTEEIKRIRASIEKCQRAYVCDPDCAASLAVWAEGLALLGQLCDRLELIVEAENKIGAALDLCPDAPEIIYSHGMCLISFARYFEDYDHYYQAIEKFQEGLSLDRTYTKLWHAIAKSYALVGDLEEDREAWDKSLRFFAKALELDFSTSSLYEYALVLFKYGDHAHDQKMIEQSLLHFERVFALQKNALYVHPDWLFTYARALDLMGDFHEEESYILRAVEIFSHVLMIDPEFPRIHYFLALALSHLGELVGEIDHYIRALHHFRLAAKHDEENAETLLDLAIALINIGQRSHDATERDALFREAEHKLILSAKGGNPHAYYHLSGLYSILGEYEKAMSFIHKSETFKALPPVDEIIADDWFDGLRSTPDFLAFLTQHEKKA